MWPTTMSQSIPEKWQLLIAMGGGQYYKTATHTSLRCALKVTIEYGGRVAQNATTHMQIEALCKVASNPFRNQESQPASSPSSWSSPRA